MFRHEYDGTGINFLLQEMLRILLLCVFRRNRWRSGTHPHWNILQEAPTQASAANGSCATCGGQVEANDSGEWKRRFNTVLLACSEVSCAILAWAVSSSKKLGWREKLLARGERREQENGVSWQVVIKLAVKGLLIALFINLRLVSAETVRYLFVFHRRRALTITWVSNNSTFVGFHHGKWFKFKGNWMEMRKRWW